MKNEDKIKKILNEVKRRIRPDMKVIVDSDKMVKKINDVLKNKKISAECVTGGSIAKGTFLKNDYDIDLFVRYNQSYEEQDISDITEKVLSEICASLKIKIERIHGSRDYFQFHVKNKKSKTSKSLAFEVIPVMHIHKSHYEKAMNITDFSPEHVDWVKKYTQKKPELMDEIRLAKQFCKANKVYGAESYINGFSGHILDIMIIHYASFTSLLKAFAKQDSLEKPIIIDTEKQLTNPLKQLNESKITPLIIVDPIQKERNSAAAVSKEKLSIFIEAAKKFLQKPDVKFFEIINFDLEKEISKSIKELGKKKIKKDSINVVKIDIDALEGSKDVVGTKILKVYETIIEHLRLNDFKVLDNGWNFVSEEKRAEAYIIVDTHITRDKMQEGPPTSSTMNYKKFVDKHIASGHEILFKDGRVCAMVPRTFLDLKSFIVDLSKKDFINNKVKGLFVR